MLKTNKTISIIIIMAWLCLVCETVNNNKNNNNDILENNSQKCVICHFSKNEMNWDKCLIMNKNIDRFFPRHQLDLPISAQLVSMVQPSLFSKENTYNYIRLRLYYRTYNIWKNWRKNTYKRRAITRIIKQLSQKYNTQFEQSIFLQYLF